MNIVSRLVREPLLHFVMIGAVVFALYAAFSADDDDVTRDRIVVTDGRLQQLAQIFTKTWQRPPTPQEMRGLLDAFIKEEVYYREAVKLGLDRDDTLVRRRMQQKMEFLTEPDETALAADDKTLQSYLEENRQDYRVEPELAFEQVFINPKSTQADANARAAEVLAALEAGGDPAALGDPTLLPKKLPLSPLSVIERDFGDSLAAYAARAKLNQWAGPVSSPFGMHLVRVSARTDSRDPALDEVRAAVLRDWRNLKREEHQAQAYAELRAKYDVILPERDAPEADRAAKQPPESDASDDDRDGSKGGES
ncbi:MAG: peptidylprolyl isomerase [Pseudomonadota bacterium]